MIHFHPYAAKTIIEGKSQNTTWELILLERAQFSFADKLITEAYCVVIYQQNVLLTYHYRRGYDLPGGYIDPLRENKNILRTMRHKVMQQTSAIVRSLQLIGFKHILTTTNEEPFESYIPYFYAYTNEFEEGPLTLGTPATHLVKYEEAQELLTSNRHHHTILQYLAEKGVFRKRE